MKHITFYFDPISPFAWLAFQRLPEVLMGDDSAPGVSYTVDYKPVLFAALLKHHGQLGPAEIPSKREWTYRHVQWLGHSLGVPLAMPAAHPFNPLPLLRLALACARSEAPGQCNRYVAELVLRHVWEGGGDATSPDRLAALQDTLAQHMALRGSELADPNGDAVKHQLRANTEEAWPPGPSACPPAWWMASCSGAWTACPCCGRTCKAMRGSRARAGTAWPVSRWVSVEEAEHPLITPCAANP
jgi:2-hydroxychromene-2-carboxylate isomerase